MKNWLFSDGKQKLLEGFCCISMGWVVKVESKKKSAAMKWFPLHKTKVLGGAPDISLGQKYLTTADPFDPNYNTPDQHRDLKKLTCPTRRGQERQLFIFSILVVTSFLQYGHSVLAGSSPNLPDKFIRPELPPLEAECPSELPPEGSSEFAPGCSLSCPFILMMCSLSCRVTLLVWRAFDAFSRILCEILKIYRWKW